MKVRAKFEWPEDSTIEEATKRLHRHFREQLELALTPFKQAKPKTRKPVPAELMERRERRANRFNWREWE